MTIDGISIEFESDAAALDALGEIRTSSSWPTTASST
jgi:hypothetical protein